MRLANGAAALAAVAARLLTGPHPIDDAYITFRYARNLADGLGLTYNPGEWVLGTTAPLWAVVLAAGHRLGATDLPTLAMAVSAVCDGLSAAMLVVLARRLGCTGWGAALVGLAWALNPMSIAFAVGGMETSLFVLLMLTTLVLAGRWPIAAAAAAGASTTVRPEGALLAGAIVAWLWLSRCRAWRRAAIGAAVPMALGGVLMTVLYGSPLPNTVAAKQVAYVPPGALDNVLALVLQAGLPGWSTFVLSILPQGAAGVLALCGVASLSVLVRKARPWRTSEWQAAALFGALYLGFYALAGLRGVRLFPWYLVPLVPLYLVSAAIGMTRLGRAARWLPALLVLWQLPAIDWRAPLLPAGYNLEREQLLFQVGSGLATSVPGNAVVAAPEIGALGYASNLRILDTVGLVSPTALRYYPLPSDQVTSDNAIPPRLIEDQRPDLVVALDEFARASLLRDAAFLRDYRMIESYPIAVWQSSRLLVFERKR
jgi:arabinofuranosyltransferase